MAKQNIATRVTPTPDTLTLGWARRIVKKTMGPRARIWDNGDGTYSIGYDKQPGRWVLYTSDDVWCLLFGTRDAPRPLCPTCGDPQVPLTAELPEGGVLRGEGCVKCQTFAESEAPPPAASDLGSPDSPPESPLGAPINDATADPVGRDGAAPENAP